MFGKTITYKSDAIVVILFLLSLKVSKHKKIGSKVDVTNMAGILAVKSVFPKTK